MIVVEVRPVAPGPGIKTELICEFALVRPGTTKPFRLAPVEAAELAKEFTKTANQFVMQRGVKE